MSEKFILRKAMLDDMMKVLELSNDPVVRQNSINQEQIELEKHQIWFKNRLKKSDEPFFIVESPSKEFIAQVRFDKNEENTISISITKPFRGKGLANLILKECSEKSNLAPIYAYIKKENTISLKSFEKAQYKTISDTIINNVEFWKLKYDP